MKPRNFRERKLLADHPVSLLTAGRGKSREDFGESLFIEKIHARAETVTPLLKEILEFRPSPHWENP